MSRLTRDGTAEPVSRNQILRHVRGQVNIHFRCSADHEQDWQPYPVDPYSAICDDHTYIHTNRPKHLTGTLWKKGDSRTTETGTPFLPGLSQCAHVDVGGMGCGVDVGS